MSGGAAIATHDVSKRYGRETALIDVSLRVPEGAVYMLAGANGAGKSTALRVLMNLERPDEDTAEVLGLDTAVRGPEVRAQVGYVPERSDHTYRSMTGAQLLRCAAAYYPAWDAGYAAHLGGVFGLRLHRRVGTLSKGEGRRLQLVLALAHRPAVLLLDEPTDGLDPLVRARLLSQLAEHLAETPTTVLISTHQVHELESLADPGEDIRADWELETQRASATQMPGGQWQVTLDVVARKVIVDEAGVETDVPMDDLIEAGVFTGTDEPKFVQMQRIRTGRQRITLTVPIKPERAAIDPRHLLIDLDGPNNEQDVR